MNFNGYLARLHMAASMERCFCGGDRGHAGWLLCVREDFRNAEQKRQAETGPEQG
jgi:hypothetical protein